MATIELNEVTAHVILGALNVTYDEQVSGVCGAGDVGNGLFLEEIRLLNFLKEKFPEVTQNYPELYEQL